MELETLTQIGLNVKEAKIYVDLLKRESASASQIAKDLGYDRTTTYYNLLQMINKGFVTSLIKEGKKHFIATQPKRVLQIIKQREEDFSRLMPKLEEISISKKQDVNIEILQGKTGLNRLFKEIIESGKELVDFGVDEERFIEYGAANFKLYVNEVNRGKIKERLLSVSGAKRIGKRSRYRFIDESYFSPVPSAVFGDKIAFILWEPNLYIILIQNKELSDSFKKRFEMLWKIAKK